MNKQTRKAPPNILLITADQFRWDALGCMGNPAIRTPNLDALAARGMLFRNAFTPDPICVPARASIMTGNYPQVCTGTKNNSGRIRDGQPLLTETLKAVGYRTYAMGKLHFVPYSPPGTPRLVHGFEHVDLTESGRILAQCDPRNEREGIEDFADYLKRVGYAGYTRAHGVGNNDVRPCRNPLPAEHTVDHWIADCTLRQLTRHQAETPDRPFFMWMSSPKPHSPYDPPAPYDMCYDPRALPPPYGDESLLDQINPHIEAIRLSHAQESLSPQARQVIKAYYYGCITWLDAMIGRVIERLEHDGLLDRTLVLFTADHGDLMGDFGAWFKCNHMNGSVRVPFIAAGPGVARGGVSEALVGLQDILPTFAAAAGADIGQPVQGLDLSPVLRDPSSAVRDLYYATTLEGDTSSAMVCDGDWKYIYSAGNATEELYDQRADPGEIVNLAGQAGAAARQNAMRCRLLEQAQALGDHALLPDGKLIAGTVDREALRRNKNCRGMGWRWY
jgi:arylsulfatase